MATQKRDFAEGKIYHVYNRGNHREMIFRDNPDRVLFLSKLDQHTERNAISILAYCLMDNHFHLILRQDSVRPITAAMLPFITGYVKSHNKKYGLVGRLFQERFRAKLIRDEEGLAYVSRYIHLNPASFTDYQSYRWSSYRQYAKENAAGMCDIGPVLDCFGGSITSYTTYLENGLTPGVSQKTVDASPLSY